VVPGARKPANRWPANRFGKLSSLLPIKTLVIGSREDIHLADMVVETSKGNAVSIAGKTDLKSLIEVIRGARFVVSNDSGPMHIAAALGIPVFALFGPANPVRTGPYGRGHKVIREEVSCAPCYRRTCDDLRCMEKLSVERVIDAIKEHQQLLR
jgi:ADP-heptose:LPS heptosyltransferase